MDEEGRNCSARDGLKEKWRQLENKMPKVFICIRLRPKSLNPKRARREFKNNIKRAKIAARYAALNGYDPEATTIYFTQFLDDSLDKERTLGMKIGQARLNNCNHLWVVTDHSELPSSGMNSDIKIAKENGIPVSFKGFAKIKKWVENYDKTSK